MNGFTHITRRSGLLGLILAAALSGVFSAPAEARRHHDDGGRSEQSSDDNSSGDRHRNRRQQENQRREQRDDRQGGWSGGGEQGQREPRMSRQEAARRAQSQYGGRVLSVNPADEGRSGYRVKILSDGTVRTLDVDEDN